MGGLVARVVGVFSSLTRCTVWSHSVPNDTGEQAIFSGMGCPSKLPWNVNHLLSSESICVYPGLIQPTGQLNCPYSKACIRNRKLVYNIDSAFISTEVYTGPFPY